MVDVFNPEKLRARSDQLAKDKKLNGIKLVSVSLPPSKRLPVALLEVYFFNTNEFENLLKSSPRPPHAKPIFSILGGSRLAAGPGAGQVQVVEVKPSSKDPKALTLTVKPIGDYSTYTLKIEHANIDPFFSEIEFKFRPGCFNLNCAPLWQPSPKPQAAPAIDYLAKDYHSFRHTLIAWMMRRLPGWEPTSEADLDMVLLELFSAAADELSDFQDRVMNEAYLGTARQRVSLARHARLMDYHIHQGNQASTWVALKTSSGNSFDLPPDFQVHTVEDRSTPEPAPEIFMTREANQRIFAILNEMKLYTWSDAVQTLPAGCTEADLAANSKYDALAIQDALRSRVPSCLLIQEHKNPVTGQKTGRDPKRRQILRLLPGDQGATARKDPLTRKWYLHVRWQEDDRLNGSYCIAAEGLDGPVVDITLFHGNLVKVYQGRPTKYVFVESGNTPPDPSEHYIIGTENWGAICELPEGPLAYRETPIGGDTPPQSTLQVDVKPKGGSQEAWQEVISFIHSAESDAHFVVETDEKGRSRIRFGDGINGRKLPEQATVECRYQVGFGPAGNVGADKLRDCHRAEIEACWNPFDVTNGTAPEPAAEIIRRAPEACRFRQLRAVTLPDYKVRAQELEPVSRAAASYAWTGSWRAVQVTVDPKGTTELVEERRSQIVRYLDAVKLIGEDLEILPPRFVPLDIRISLCAAQDFWTEDVRSFLLLEFSDGYTPDGRMAFFHPDLWTFGQPIRASQILGRVQSVAGVDHVIQVALRRWQGPSSAPQNLIEVRPNEIILVKNDPDHLEKGFITFAIFGGRR